MKIKLKHQWLVDQLTRPNPLTENKLKEAYLNQFGSALSSDDFTPGQKRILEFNKLMDELQKNHPEFLQNVRGFADFEDKLMNTDTSLDKNISDDQRDPLLKILTKIKKQFLELKDQHDRQSASSTHGTTLNACHLLLDIKFNHPALQSKLSQTSANAQPQATSSQTNTTHVKNAHNKNKTKSKINPVLVAGLIFGGIVLAAGIGALLAVTLGGAAPLLAILGAVAVTAAGAGIVSTLTIRHIYKKSAEKRELNALRGEKHEAKKFKFPTFKFKKIKHRQHLKHEKPSDTSIELVQMDEVNLSKTKSATKDNENKNAAAPSFLQRLFAKAPKAEPVKKEEDQEGETKSTQPPRDRSGSLGL